MCHTWFSSVVFKQNRIRISEFSEFDPSFLNHLVKFLDAVFFPGCLCFEGVKRVLSLDDLGFKFVNSILKSLHFFIQLEPAHFTGALVNVNVTTRCEQFLGSSEQLVKRFGMDLLNRLGCKRGETFFGFHVPKENTFLNYFFFRGWGRGREGGAVSNQKNHDTWHDLFEHSQQHW